MQQVVVVACVQLDEYIVLAGGEVTFHHFGYLSQRVHHILELRGVAQEYSHVSAGLVAKRCGLHQALGAAYHPVGCQALYALVHGRAAHPALAGYFQIWFSRVLRQMFQDTQVK